MSINYILYISSKTVIINGFFYIHAIVICIWELDKWCSFLHNYLLFLTSLNMK